VEGLLKKNKHRTSNIERPTSNVEWKKMKKQTYDLEERWLKLSQRVPLIKKPELLSDILKETEELKFSLRVSKRLKRNANKC